MELTLETNGRPRQQTGKQIHNKINLVSEKCEDNYKGCDRKQQCRAFLDRVIREDFSEEVTSDLGPQWHKGASHVTQWGKSVPGRGNSKCKGPAAGMCLERTRYWKEAGVAGGHRQARGVWLGTRLPYLLQPVGNLDLILKMMRNHGKF